MLKSGNPTPPNSQSLTWNEEDPITESYLIFTTFTEPNQAIMFSSLLSGCLSLSISRLSLKKKGEYLKQIKFLEQLDKTDWVRTKWWWNCWLNHSGQVYWKPCLCFNPYSGFTGALQQATLLAVLQYVVPYYWWKFYRWFCQWRVIYLASLAFNILFS